MNRAYQMELIEPQGLELPQMVGVWLQRATRAKASANIARARGHLGIADYWDCCELAAVEQADAVATAFEFEQMAGLV